jgi:hypothetical protein
MEQAHMPQNKHWIRCAIGTVAIVLLGVAVSRHLPAVSAEKPEAVEVRLKRLEDREEIRQLLMDYGRFLDRRDFVAFSELFAEKEGEWIGGLGKAQGAQAIRKLMEDTIGKGAKNPGAPNYHLFGNETIGVEGDKAKAMTKWMFVVQGDAGRPQPFYLGHYEDTFVRENGRWKFLRRVVYGDIPADDPLARK